MTAQPHKSPRNSGRILGCQAAGSARSLLTQLRRAVELHLAGDYPAAETLLRAVLKLESGLPQAHHHLAVVLHARGQYDEALGHLEAAERPDPHLPGTQNRLEGYRLDVETRRTA